MLQPIGNDTKKPIYIDTAVDAVFLRYHYTENFPFPGLATVWHFIVNHWIDPSHLAQNCPQLEDLTIVVHGSGYACRSFDLTKKYPLQLYKPGYMSKEYCDAQFRSQDKMMESFKLANPKWRKPVLNVMSATIEGRRCCWLKRYAIHTWYRWHLAQVELQNSTFWDEHSVPEPQF